MSDNLEMQAAGFSALSHVTRLKIFRVLISAGDNGLPAGMIAEHVGVEPNFLTTHLTTLTRSGLVSSRKDGRRVIYKAENEAVRSLMVTLVETCCDGRPDMCASLNPVLDAVEKS